MLADNTVLCCSYRNSFTVQVIVNNEFYKLSKWFLNKLSLSLNETENMILSKLKTDEPSSVKINDFEIVQAHSYKYIGIIIDDKLKRLDHFTHIFQKISKFSGRFYRIKCIARDVRVNKIN